MPRPKRLKIVSAHAKAQAAAAQKTTQKKTAASTRATPPTKIRKTSFDDTTTGIARTPKGRTESRDFTRQDGLEISMSGGLGAGDVRSAQKVRDEQRRQSQSDTEPIRESSRNSTSRPPLADISSHGNANPLARSVKRFSEARKSPWQGRNKEPLDDGFEEYLRSSSPHLPTTVISRPPSASKVLGTPSFLSITNFKRRPRQPSILRMVQQKVGTDVENEDESEPDATLEGIGSSPNHSPIEQSSRSSKRKAATLESDDLISSPEKDAHGTTKSNGSVDLSISPSETAPEQGSHHEAEAEEASSSSPGLPAIAVANKSSAPAFKKTPPPRRRGRRIQPKHAAPLPTALSSPPISDTSPRSTPSGHDYQTNKRLAKRQKISQAKHPQTVTTASLQSLLPRRRTRAPAAQQDSAFDLSSSYESEPTDEDEVWDVIRVEPANDTAHGIDGQIQPEDDEEDELTKPQPISRAIQGMATRQKPARTVTADGSLNRKKRISKTYSCRKKGEPASEDSVVIDSRITLSDGEEGHGDAASGKATKGNSNAVQTREMATAAEKFQAVDDWDMSFESVDVGGGRSSSPWR